MASSSSSSDGSSLLWLGVPSPDENFPDRLVLLLALPALVAEAARLCLGGAGVDEGVGVLGGLPGEVRLLERDGVFSFVFDPLVDTTISIEVMRVRKRV